MSPTLAPAGTHRLRISISPLLFLLSLVRRSTPHKWKITGLAVLAMAVVVPITISSFHERFASRPIYDGPDGERLAFERAAKAMWNDHPLGVGANVRST